MYTKPWLLRQARAYSKMHVEVSSVKPVMQDFGDSLYPRATTILITQSPPTTFTSVKAPPIPRPI